MPKLMASSSNGKNGNHFRRKMNHMAIATEKVIHRGQIADTQLQHEMSSSTKCLKEFSNFCKKRSLEPV
jgi:hypothetical protein